MNLITKCPQCKTSFAASLEQLQLRKGFIRCVECAHIFDGYEAVVPEQSVPANIPSVVRQRSPKPERVSEPKPSNVHIISELSGADVVRDLEVDQFIISDVKSEESLNHTIVNESSKLNVSDHDHKLESEADLYTDRWSTVVLVFWMLLIALGVAFLLLQLVFVFRVQIAEAVPSMRPRIERMCDALNCSVAWSRKSEFILVTHSSLQSDPAYSTEDNENHVILQVNLRNTYDKAQEWPTLVLDLTDAAGARIARKHIPADSYLPAGAAFGPFPASSEQNINLPLTLHGLKVNGYQLTTFFP